MSQRGTHKVILPLDGAMEKIALNVHSLLWCFVVFFFDGGVNKVFFS